MKDMEEMINEMAMLYPLPTNKLRQIYSCSKRIKESFNFLFPSACPVSLKDWQICQIAYAINAYASGHYFLCNVSLLLAFKEDISKEPWCIRKLREEAASIDLKKMIESLPDLTQFRINQLDKVSYHT